MSNPGWYPDPGGQPGLFRWWTGAAWTESVTGNPQQTQPPSPGPIPGSHGFYQAKSRNTGWWIAGGVALVAIVVAIVLVVQSMASGVAVVPGLPGDPPTSTRTPNICPPKTGSTTQPTNAARPGWVSGGRLAYPALGSPWKTTWDNRVPWGDRAAMQKVTVQENYNGKGNSWMASILVSDLYVGDGFASTKVAAETVLTCVLGIFYHDTEVTQEQIKSAKHDVDGHSGWLIESQLSFSIPGLKAEGERVLLMVVKTGDEQYGLYYASIPDPNLDLLPDARKALSGLKVQ